VNVELLGADVPEKSWSAKRERLYQHVKVSLLEQGKPRPLAEQIAARVVNKERAQHGEAKTASASSATDMLASRRGGCMRTAVAVSAPWRNCATLPASVA
jgi:hypothetical protein